MSKLLSEKWDGDATQWAEFKIFIKKKLLAGGNANMIIPEGEQGHIPDVPLASTGTSKLRSIYRFPTVTTRHGPLEERMRQDQV